ncbi:MAG TPA: hypothetical protein VMY99_00685 [Nevskiaceae bacterium]|nr:hypothetical protein [Nevskiaceae bacterium]
MSIAPEIDPSANIPTIPRLPILRRVPAPVPPARQKPSLRSEIFPNRPADTSLTGEKALSVPEKVAVSAAIVALGAMAAAVVVTAPKPAAEQLIHTPSIPAGTHLPADAPHDPADTALLVPQTNPTRNVPRVSPTNIPGPAQ